MINNWVPGTHAPIYEVCDLVTQKRPLALTSKATRDSDLTRSSQGPRATDHALPFRERRMWRQGTSSVLERRDVFRFERRSEQTRPDSNRLVSAKTNICVAETISIIVFLLELDDFLCL